MHSRNQSHAFELMARKIKDKREKLGLTKVQAAEKYKVGRNFIRDVEEGKNTAQIGKVIQYANGLGLDLSFKEKKVGNEIKALETSIKILLKTNKMLAVSIINSLTEEQKSQMDIYEVKIRTKKRIKELSLQFGES